MVSVVAALNIGDLGEIAGHAKVREFESERKFCTVCRKLVIEVETDQNVTLFDVEVQNLLLMNSLQGLSQLTKNDIGCPFFKWLREEAQRVRRSIVRML